MSLDAAIALSRFGLGAKVGDLQKIGDARAALKAQLKRTSWPATPKGLPSSAEYLAGVKKAGKDLTDQEKIDYAKRAYSNYYAEVAYRTAAAITHDDSFRERLVWFWSNHFTVAASNIQAIAFVGASEREAIRPHITGKFRDMLLAVARDPGMLIYLDNAQSIGPSSRAGRFVKRGLNENFAREVLELHTLGVDGGYTQDDVIALAKILTGWSVVMPGKGDGKTSFVYYDNRHEPGPKQLLGKTYQNSNGEQEGIEALGDLARHPSTAKFIATKFARHFIADAPPAASVARLEKVFLETGGDLGALAAAAVDDPAAWATPGNKMRTPTEFVVAASRAFAPTVVGGIMAVAEEALKGTFGRAELRGRRDLAAKYPGLGVIEAMRIMGQFPFTAPSPKGWSDEANAWATPEGIMERIEWASELGERMPTSVSPTDLAENVLGPLLSGETRRALDLAASPAQGFALVLASPEFQRR